MVSHYIIVQHSKLWCYYVSHNLTVNHPKHNCYDCNLQLYNLHLHLNKLLYLCLHILGDSGEDWVTFFLTGTTFWKISDRCMFYMHWHTTGTALYFQYINNKEYIMLFLVHSKMYPHIWHSMKLTQNVKGILIKKIP